MVRFKNRWFLVELIPVNSLLDQPGSNSALDGKKIYNALKHSILSNFGDTGWGAVGLSLTVKYFSPMTNMCIIRVGRDQHRIVWGGLTMLKDIDGSRFIPNVVHLSGTIKHAQLAAISYNRLVIARFRARSELSATYHDSYSGYLETSEREIEALQD